MKKMLSRLNALAVIAFILATLFAWAPSQARANGMFSPTDTQNPQNIACRTLRVELSTTPVLIVSGAGILYELDSSSGNTTAAFTMAFDSNVVTGGILSGSVAPLGVSNNGNSTLATLPTGVAISPKVFTSGAGGVAPGTATGGVLGAYYPPIGRRFKNGLVVANSDAGVLATGCYIDQTNVAVWP